MARIVITIEVPDGVEVSVRTDSTETQAPPAVEAVAVHKPGVTTEDLRAAFLTAVRRSGKEVAFRCLNAPRISDVKPADMEAIYLALQVC